MNQLSRIRSKIGRLQNLDESFKIFGSSTHKYRLNSPVKSNLIIDFEKKYNLKLPQDYREFLLKVGNGICGPYYGLIEFESALNDDVDSNNSRVLLDPSKPFKFIEKWNFEVGDTNEEADEEYFKRKEEANYYDSSHMNGSLRICNYGCGVSYNLVVKGPEKGHIWIDDRCNDQGIYPNLLNKAKTTFLDWYENWQDNSLEKISIKISQNSDLKMNNEGKDTWLNWMKSKFNK